MSSLNIFIVKFRFSGRIAIYQLVLHRSIRSINDQWINQSFASLFPMEGLNWSQFYIHKWDVFTLFKLWLTKLEGGSLEIKVEWAVVFLFNYYESLLALVTSVSNACVLSWQRSCKGPQTSTTWNGLVRTQISQVGLCPAFLLLSVIVHTANEQAT